MNQNIFKEFFVLCCCIDLVLTSRLTLAVDSGVHPSLHPNGHDQMVHAKFNLKIHFPPHHERGYGIANNETLNLLKE